MAYKHPCLLYERECIGCGECDRCDLNPDKICDNCMKCVLGEAEYRAVSITEIQMEREAQTSSDQSL